MLGWIGLVCWIAIIPIKSVRWIHIATGSALIGVAPSFLGPAGLLFVILSGSGKLSRLTLVQATLLTAAIALGLEFAQLLPRPGILAKVHYTFDWLDVLASALSVCAGYLVARLMMHERRGADHGDAR